MFYLITFAFKHTFKGIHIMCKIMCRKVFTSKSGNGVGEGSRFYIVKVLNFHSFTVFNYSIQILHEVKYQV